MLIYSTSGYGYSKRLCTDILQWFCAEYMPRHKVAIDVHHCGLRYDDSYGFCDVIDGFRRPREFKISLQSRMSKHDYTTTLLHEMVHVHQWVTGTLTSKCSRMHYKGEEINRDDYDNQPHEIDARNKEHLLYSQFTGNPKFYRHFKNCHKMVVHVG